MKRVDALLVQFVITEYDAEGRPIADALTQQPVKFFVSTLDALTAKIAEIDAELSNGER